MQILFLRFRQACLSALAALLLVTPIAHGAVEPLVLNDDAGWCWFEDPRVVVDGKQVVAGTVANGRSDPGRRGDIEVVSCTLGTTNIRRCTLHKNLQADDHDSPALLLRPDGRWLALYSQHGAENRIYYRVSVRPHDATEWQEEKVFVPSASSRITYSNPFWLSRERAGQGRLFNFFRGYDNTSKPSWMFSDDLGGHWTMGGLLVNFQARRKHRPYAKYASNGKDAIHFAFTEGHPMEFDTGIYHAVYRKGQLYDSRGTRVRPLAEGPVLPAEATCIFRGDSNNIAWVHGIALDAKGHPRVAYTVQKGAAGVPKGKAGQDLRYRFASWDGSRWQDREIAYAGTTLYTGEDDYAGGIALHPRDSNTLFISANIDPATGQNPGHFEIYRGQSRDGGDTWTWTPVTRNSAVDNLRPVVPSSGGNRTLLLWLRGRYLKYTNYSLELVLAQPES